MVLSCATLPYPSYLGLQTSPRTWAAAPSQNPFRRRVPFVPSAWTPPQILMSDTHSDDEGELGIFAEPAAYYQPEKQPTFASHEMQDGKELRLRMVGHNPLWVSASTV